MINLKPVMIAPLFTLLVSCGGSDSGDDSGPNIVNDPVTQSATCGTAYYSELPGDYEGQIMYSSDTATCMWQTDLTITTSAGLIPEICEVKAKYSSNLISGDLVCGDVSVTTQLIEPYGGNLNADELADPDWPIDGYLQLNAALDADQVFPVGNTGEMLVFILQFDGDGSVNFPPNADSDFTGTLIRQ